MKSLNNYKTFEREFWSLLSTKKISNDDSSGIEDLFGFAEPVSITEINEIYVPIVSLLDKIVRHRIGLVRDIGSFTKTKIKKPFIIGIAGSVSVGKSTTARLIKYLLQDSSLYEYKVSLVPTDGFLFPNKELEDKGLTLRKGFPESYDINKLLKFLQQVKSNHPILKIPVYSHHQYDIIADSFVTIDCPDIVILEGLNVLQIPNINNRHAINRQCVSDFIDFGIYLDAITDDLESWFVKRFISFQESSKRDSSSYMYKFKDLNKEETVKFATKVWREINLINLEKNILPSRSRSNLIMCKESNHKVSKIMLNI